MVDNVFTTPSVAADALQIEQADHLIYVTALTAKQLIQSTTIDHYDSSLAPGDHAQGYQRPPERSRITRIGTYLIKNQGDGLYPTAVLLGSREPLRYDAVAKKLEVPLNNTLRVIDGQHRMEGLRYAIEEKGQAALAYMEIPAVIIEVQNRIEEMEQFRIINGTAKSVRTDLVNSILTAIAQEEGEDAIPEKDIWKVVVTRVVDELNRRDDSPWKDVLLMPDEVGKADAPHKITRATSAITSIRPVYEWLMEFGAFGSMAIDDRVTRLADILVAYWRAVRNVVPEAFAEPKNFVIQKTPGMFALHYLLRDELLRNIYRGRREWDEPTFQEFIQDSPEIGDPIFWRGDANRASGYGGMKGFRELANLLIDSVQP